jgi:hypothetical protein
MIWNEVSDVINTFPERKSFNRIPNAEKKGGTILMLSCPGTHERFLLVFKRTTITS